MFERGKLWNVTANATQHGAQFVFGPDDSRLLSHCAFVYAVNKYRFR